MSLWSGVDWWRQDLQRFVGFQIKCFIFIIETSRLEKSTFSTMLYYRYDGLLKNVERILILFKPYCKHLTQKGVHDIPSKCQCLSNAWRFASFNLEWFFHPFTYMKHHNLTKTCFINLCDFLFVAETEVDKENQTHCDNHNYANITWSMTSQGKTALSPCPGGTRGEIY